MNNLRILHWNSNGILNKIQELQLLINNLNIDVILLNETHLKPTATLKLPNYFIYRSDLPPVRGSPAHGSTAIIVHRRIVHQLTTFNTELQSTSIIIKLNNIEIMLSAVYKPYGTVAALTLLASHCITTFNKVTIQIWHRLLQRTTFLHGRSAQTCWTSL